MSILLLTVVGCGAFIILVLSILKRTRSSNPALTPLGYRSPIRLVSVTDLPTFDRMVVFRFLLRISISIPAIVLIFSRDLAFGEFMVVLVVMSTLAPLLLIKGQRWLGIERTMTGVVEAVAEGVVVGAGGAVEATAMGREVVLAECERILGQLGATKITSDAVTGRVIGQSKRGLPWARPELTITVVPGNGQQYNVIAAGNGLTNERARGLGVRSFFKALAGPG